MHISRHHKIGELAILMWTGTNYPSKPGEWPNDRSENLSATNTTASSTALDLLYQSQTTESSHLALALPSKKGEINLGNAADPMHEAAKIIWLL